MCGDQIFIFGCMEEESLNVLNLILPEFLVDHFEIKKIDKIGSRIDLYLEEKSEVPKEFETVDIISHGFHKQSTIKDFPLRGKQVLLYVKRRRWLNKHTNEIVSRDWKVIAQGTRMTKEFAFFLKGIN